MPTWRFGTLQNGGQKIRFFALNFFLSLHTKPLLTVQGVDNVSNKKTIKIIDLKKKSCA